jgi:hypothetical protein
MEENTNDPDIFDYIVEAFEIVVIIMVRCINYIVC